MSDFNVEFGTMDEAGQILGQVFGQLTEIGTNLDTQVKSGTVEFVGSAKEAFVMAQQKYDQAHQELATSLQAANQGLEEIKQSYLEGNRKAESQWQH